MLLPLQGEYTRRTYTQGDALGLLLDGLSGRIFIGISLLAKVELLYMKSHRTKAGKIYTISSPSRHVLMPFEAGS